jgi:catechol 2,3-dioxygenase-like lactoylglutathione lyase family enzyme
MRSRSGGWWGPAVEAPDPRALAGSYAELLGWPVVHEEEGTAVVGAPGGAFLVFQQADGYRRPVWPPSDGEQRPMMHLDFQVDDLDDAVAEAVGLGAELAGHQPQEHVRVLLDPAGHPFCLCLEQDGS